jgi:hypothetical protein
MWFMPGIIGGIIAGVFMGIASQIAYLLGIFKSNLIVIDGSFLIQIFRSYSSLTVTYALGIVIHLATSIVFGTIYFIISRFVGFDPVLPLAIIVYTMILWMTMLCVALPVAGKGFMGNKISNSVWLEQLVLHIIFGFSF